MKRNTLLFITLLSVVVLFICIMLTLFWLNRREFERYERRATAQAIKNHEQLQALEGTVLYLESQVDSLQTMYVRDSTHWHEERTQLKGSLWQQQQQARSFQEAYEKSQRRRSSSSPTPTIPARRPSVYDLSPVLDDSTDRPRPNAPPE